MAVLGKIRKFAQFLKLDYNMDTIQIKDKRFKRYPRGGYPERGGTCANEINHDLEGENPLFLSVLNGSFMFTADLMKHLTIPCEISFVRLASYAGTASTGKVKELVGLNEDIFRTYGSNRGGYCGHGADHAAFAGNPESTQSERNPYCHTAGETG